MRAAGCAGMSASSKAMNPSPKLNHTIIYPTGCTPDGIVLIGGIWKLWEQEGFPIEMAHLLCQQHGWKVDWLEAMADASTTNNCPALMDHLRAFLPREDLALLQRGFMAMSGTSFEEIIARKRENGRCLAQEVAS